MPAGRCPVCQAAFRFAAECPRCGADLSRLMRLSVESWKLRQSAAESLIAGQYDRAAVAADSTEVIVHTGRGAFLRTLAEWMKTTVR